MEAKPKSRDLGASFSQMFELIPALDDVALEQVYRVRHDVYCRDLGWEPMRENGLETDEFDRHSLHCLLRCRTTGEPVGCTRLILARPEAPDHPFPFEQSCREVLDRSIADPARLPRHTLGEVSRLAVLNTFRKRRGEESTAVSMSEDDFGGPGPQQRFPFVPVSLYLGAAAIARRFGIPRLLIRSVRTVELRDRAKEGGHRACLRSFAGELFLDGASNESSGIKSANGKIFYCFSLLPTNSRLTPDFIRYS